MLAEFEGLARQCPQAPCFYFVDGDGRRAEFSYSDVRWYGAAIAFLLQSEGVTRGSLVSVDMSNCPAFVFLVIAAAYGGFTLVALNHRLTDEEKADRLRELAGLDALRMAAHLSEESIGRLLEKARLLGDGGQEGPGGLSRKKKKARQPEGGSLNQGEVLHWIERGVAFFGNDAPALVLFTSGTAGRPKAVPLTWGNLRGSAEASNDALNVYGQGMWQAALPLFHIGGFQIIVRSILNATPFILYRRFDADRILADAAFYGATHISVVDKMLQDLLASARSDDLQEYRCILLGGGAPNPATLERALRKEARVYVSYGMTETSSQIASSLAGAGYDGSCRLLPGYEVQIVAPDERGIGQLAVRGPGVFADYLNGHAAFTVDGFFLTGDTASMVPGRIKVEERVSDMFVSGGENVYPAEIRDKLMWVPGVSDAYVFGVEDEAWGRRPVALVERRLLPEEGRDAPEGGAGVLGEEAGIVREEAGASGRGAPSPQAFAEEVQKSLEQRLSKIYRPRHICVMDSFPRTGLDKPDRTELRRLYGERLEVREVRLYHIRQRFLAPITTAKTSLRFRDSVIVEAVDWAGRSGLGECVAFPTGWYLPETLGEDVRVLKDYLIPLVLRQVYLHPQEVSACFDECAEADAYPMAKAALEPALWDLYGKVTGKPLWQLIGGKAGYGDGDPDGTGQGQGLGYGLFPDGAGADRKGPVAVPAGAVLGIMSASKTFEAAQAAVEEGYPRIKIKIRPGDDLARVGAVREVFPDTLITLDANQSYSERDLAELQAFDGLAIRCIEEPLDPARLPKVGPTDLFARLARLQKELATTVSLDESWVGAADLDRALTFPELRSYVLKIAKLGGVAPALAAYRRMRAQGVEAWMGGMYENGVSKYLHAAFETLPGITLPGDLSSTSRYFADDICDPPFEVKNGSVLLNPSGHEAGLGCTLNHDALDKLLLDYQEFTGEDGPATP